MKNSDQHKWNKEDLTLAYYHALYGEGGLQIGSATELAEHVIDSSRQSLEMQAANFRYILQLDGYQLEHFSSSQATLVVELNKLSEIELRNKCNHIIFENMSKSKELKQQKVAENRETLKAKYRAESDEKLQRELGMHASMGRNLKFKSRREVAM